MSTTSVDGEGRYSTVKVAEFLESLLHLEQLDTGLFRSKKLVTPKNARGTYGGQLIAHALQAAQATVSEEKRVHSLRSNFLAAGDSSAPMYYAVKRLRDGKSFAVRSVTAFQKSEPVYVATLSFQVPEEPGIQHSTGFPADAPPPEKAVSQADQLARLIDGAPTVQLKENFRRKFAPAIHVRYTNRVSLKNPLKTQRPMRSWFKCDHIPDDPAVHRALAFFATDFTLALSPLAVHGLPNPDLRMIVSLDHTIYFHEDFSVREWFLYEVHSSWAGSNRGLCHGRIYTRDGRHVMTVIQETLIRMKKGYASTAKL